MFPSDGFPGGQLNVNIQFVEANTTSLLTGKF